MRYPYLISYDIASPKRWRRVFAHLKRCGEHRQLSVFVVRTDANGARQLAEELARLIDPDEDNVLIVRLQSSESLAGSATLGGKLEQIGPRLLIV